MKGMFFICANTKLGCESNLAEGMRRNSRSGLYDVPLVPAALVVVEVPLPLMEPISPPTAVGFLVRPTSPASLARFGCLVNEPRAIDCSEAEENPTTDALRSVGGERIWNIDVGAEL